MIWLECLSLGGVLLFLYSYAFYPMLLALLAGGVQLKRDVWHALSKNDRRSGMQPTELPRVAVVIAAFNEEKHIAERVSNLLSLQYPEEKICFYIGSDGSSDATAKILSSFSDERLKAFAFDENRGKASVLNDLVSRGNEEIIVFSDANTFFLQDALLKLVAPFADSGVGCVSGELHLNSTGGNNQDGVYWRVEQLLKFFESRIGGLLGANGAIYAIRRHFWVPLKSDTICDDFCVAMSVSAAGGRLTYTPEAKAFEEMPDSIDDEYHRRIRIGIGNFQALFRHPEYLIKTTWGTRFSYFSHKVLRWLSPHLLLISTIASIAMSVIEPRWLPWAIVEVLGLLIAVLAFLSLRLEVKKVPSVVKILAFLFALNWAFLVASWRFATGQYSGSWRRTSR